MKKQNILNLIKYHVERNEVAFRKEAIIIAEYFDKTKDTQVAEYILNLIHESNLHLPNPSIFESNFLRETTTENLEALYLPKSISDDVQGIINAVSHNIGINKFLFEGLPGSGKTEAAKNVARLLNRPLFIVDFEQLIDSRLGKTNKNINQLFREINRLEDKKAIILFDEIDAIALDRINQNDIREMGRATSTILKELDRMTDLNQDIIIIATTNLFTKLDKALARRFDAVINFNRYSREDLIEVAENYFSTFIKNFKQVAIDKRLFKKIVKLADTIPYPADLKNTIKKSIAFSNPQIEFDYLRIFYNNLIGGLDKKNTAQLQKEGYTLKEIEKLKGTALCLKTK